MPRTSPPRTGSYGWKMIELVIFDRDNTLIALPPGARYVRPGDPVMLFPGAAAAIARLKTSQVAVTVATNQQGIALAEYPDITAEFVDRVHAEIQDQLGRAGAHIDRFYCCPHRADSGCRCRKPNPGMLLDALRDFGVDPTSAVMVGDSERDVEAARRAGIRSLRIDPPRFRFDQLVEVLSSM